MINITINGSNLMYYQTFNVKVGEQITINSTTKTGSSDVYYGLAGKSQGFSTSYPTYYKDGVLYESTRLDNFESTLTRGYSPNNVYATKGYFTTPGVYKFVKAYLIENFDEEYDHMDLYYDKLIFYVTSASNIRVKTSSGWQEGKAYVKTSSGWQESSDVYVKTSSGWQKNT